MDSLWLADCNLTLSALKSDRVGIKVFTTAVKVGWDYIAIMEKVLSLNASWLMFVGEIIRHDIISIPNLLLVITV